MNKIRYFGQLADPAYFKRKHGVRGWLVWAVNCLRERLEAWLALSILDIELKTSGWTKADRKRILAQAKDDPSFRPEIWHVVATRKHRTVLQDRLPELYDAVHASRESRYAGGRKNSADSPYERPIPFMEGMAVTFQHEGEKIDRSSRYASGRHTHIVSDDDFVRVPPMKGAADE